MNYSIELHPKVQKFLDKADDHIVRRFGQKAKMIAQDPFSDLLDTKPLKGKESAWRLRIGKYRFLYTIEHDKILIFFFDADSRGDIYR